MLQAGEPYVYAGDDPVNEWDPKGLLPKYVGANGAVEAPAGIIRALDWGASWPTGDLEDAIEQAFQVGSRSGELVVATPGQGQGKIIFSGSETDVEVVYDSEGDYYRVLKLQENGQIMALNSEGSFIPDTPQYYSETHFNNTGHIFTSVDEAANWVDSTFGEPASGPDPEGGDYDDPGYDIGGGGGGGIGGPRDVPGICRQCLFGLRSGTSGQHVAERRELMFESQFRVPILKGPSGNER